jgi:two-component system NtrC family response regulator
MKESGTLRILAVDDDLEHLSRTPCDLVFADLNMPPPDGFEVLRGTQRLTPPPPVVVITALDSARPAVEALRLGALDYLVKPADPAAIRAAVSRIAAVGDIAQPAEQTFGLVGASAAIRRVRRLIPLFADSAESVLILGETGSGKELVARALHEHGPRRDGPFVAHNMAATPGELAESIFFGHVRGAFSGATEDHPGLFERAEGGTLFLDEVESFPIALQAKLLRVLESGRVHRVGGQAERSVNARVIAASSADLGMLTQRSAFRADLYYRLRQLEIVMPSLRERPQDIEPLAAHFLADLAQQTGRVATLSRASMDRLHAHAWPGNCRELRNALRSAALLARGGPILPGHLPRGISNGPRLILSGEPSLERIEHEHILRTLEATGGNQSRAARLLGIDRGTLARKLRRRSTPEVGPG